MLNMASQYSTIELEVETKLGNLDYNDLTTLWSLAVNML